VFSNITSCDHKTSFASGNPLFSFETQLSISLSAEQRQPINTIIAQPFSTLHFSPIALL